MDSSPDVSMTLDARPSAILSDALTGALKMKQLNEKLTNLQTSLEGEKEARMTSYQSMIKKLDDQLTRLRLSEDTRNSTLKETLCKLQESILAHTSDRDRLDERRTKEVKLVSTNFTIDVNLERQNRRECEAKLFKSVDEKMLNAKLEVANERNTREESCSQRLSDLAERLGEIQDEVEAESQERENAYAKIRTTLTEGVNGFYQELAEEAQQWDSARDSLIRSIGDMTATVRCELEKERKERGAIEDKLIGLLEETCYRVEQGLSYSPFP